jgi:Pycsar effector protein
VPADPAIGYLASLLEDARDELNRADSKASLLLAAIGVIIGALIAGLAGSKWTPMRLETGAQAVWWAGVAAAAAGVVWIAASVYPRIHQPETLYPGMPAYYGDVAAYQDVNAFRDAISRAPEARERLINQTYVVSKIVQWKYVLLRRGLLSISAAIIACMLAVIINLVVR